MLRLALYIVAPLLIGLVAYIWWPEFLGLSDAFGAQEVWPFFGYFMGYLSLVVSAYALWEVRQLSNRYLVKQRLPQLKGQVDQIMKGMKELQDEPLGELRSQTLLAQCRVVLKHLQGKAPGFEDVVERAEELRKQLSDQVNQSRQRDNLVRDTDVFWELYRTLSEIMDEISAYKSDSEASI